MDKNFEDWLITEIRKHSESSTLYAQDGDYENAQFEVGIAEGLQLVWDKLFIKKEKEQ